MQQELSAKTQWDCHLALQPCHGVTAPDAAACSLIAWLYTFYIWEIDKTVASVDLGVTLFGLTCYAFIIIAGTVSVSCPYQTPGALMLCYLWQKVPNGSTFLLTKS